MAQADAQLEYLERVQAAPPTAQAPAPSPPTPTERESEIYRNISATYHKLRLGMATLAIVFPIALWLGADPPVLQSSLSAYYHYADPAGSPYGGGDMRNVFVGVLWAIGFFLILYKGYSPRENWALNFAGLGAIMVSLFPTNWPPNPAESWIGKVHFGSAALFFVLIAYVCVFRSSDTLKLMKDEAARRPFRRWYNLLGGLMIALPATVFVLHLLDTDRTGSKAIWFIEALGIWVFGSFWIVKSAEIRQLERPQPGDT